MLPGESVRIIWYNLKLQSAEQLISNIALCNYHEYNLYIINNKSNSTSPDLKSKIFAKKRFANNAY